MGQPSHGFTRDGKAVHARTIDHLPTHNAYARFNKRVATWLVENVGTMTCYWIFNLIALISLPAVLIAVSHAFFGWFPTFMVKASLVTLIMWLSSNYIQLTLLPAIMVGQNIQAEASDARAAKTYEDAEKVLNIAVEILDRLDPRTPGGITELVNEIEHHSVQLGRIEKSTRPKPRAPRTPKGETP